MPKYHEIIASLKKHAPYLQDAVHRDLADGLKADGLVEDGNGGQVHAAADGVSRIRSINAACADPVLATKLRRIVAFAAHRGVALEVDRVIRPLDLDKQLAASRATIDDRMAIKNELFLAGCLPA